MKLIDYKNSLINEYSTTFLCVIHENPGSNEKARGHLGTELRNKASTVIQIGFKKRQNQEDSEIIAVKTLKNRIGKRPEPFYAVFDSSSKGLIEVDKESVESIMDTPTNQKLSVNQVKKVLPELLPCSRQQLIGVLTDRFSVSRNTVISRIDELVELKEFELGGVYYNLHSQMKGREKHYNISHQTGIKL